MNMEMDEDKLYIPNFLDSSLLAGADFKKVNGEQLIYFYIFDLNQKQIIYILQQFSHLN